MALEVLCPARKSEVFRWDLNESEKSKYSDESLNVRESEATGLSLQIVKGRFGQISLKMPSFILKS